MQVLKTSEDVKKYQEIEPFPNWEIEYTKYLYKLDDYEKNRNIEDKFYGDENLLRQFNYDIDAYIKFSAKSRADYLVRNGTLMSWKTTRRLVWLRDSGICDICLRKIGLGEYECGHIIDYAYGGSNRLENLTVMCGFCNHKLKLFHKTKEEYYVWRDDIRKKLALY